jgi:CyaY protein
MTETEYLQQTQMLFNTVMAHIEDNYPDLDAQSQGAIVEIENDDGQKIIINQQTPMQEVWLASRSGGYHFKWNGATWVNTRDGADFWEFLRLALIEISP